MERSRSAAVFLALADAVLVVAGVLVAITRAGSDRVAFLSAGSGEPSSPAAGGKPAPGVAPRPVTAAEVSARPQPPQVMAKGRWSATLEGTGERVRFYAPVVAVDAQPHMTLELTSSDPRPITGTDGSVRYTTGTAFALPDGTRWYPIQPFRVQGGGSPSLTGASAAGGTVTGTVDAGYVVGLLAAGGEVTGRFVQRDGTGTTTLLLPSGTRLSADCAGRTPADVPAPCPGTTTASTATVGPVEVSIEARPGMRLEVDGGAGKS